MLYTWNSNVSLHVNYISILKILLESIYKHKSLKLGMKLVITIEEITLFVPKPPLLKVTL